MAEPMKRVMRNSKFCLVLLLSLVSGTAWSQTAAPMVVAKPAPPSAVPANAIPKPGTAAVTDYVIGADDTLQVTVWKEDKISGSFLVRPDGMISMVLLGDVPAAGFTPMQLGNEITVRLKKYIQDPNVTVLVSAAGSHRILVTGEVNRVGPLPLAADMTALEAIITAGGLTPFANQKHIYILRKVDGKTRQIPFNYKEALKGADHGVPLISGDTIVVP
jgi:polysaccharide biosynthesis/export protein